MILAGRIAVGLVLVLFWALTARATGPLIAGPWETAVAARDLIRSGELPRALAQTLGVYLSGVALAGIAGVALGLVLGGLPRLGQIREPYVHALTATPQVAFIPLIIVVLGLGFDAKTSAVFLGALMPILINTFAGVLTADPDLVEMARASGATRPQIFAHVLLPGAVPFILAGLRLGATIGLINTIVAELYTAVQGPDGLLALYGNTFRMAPYFAVVVTLAILGALLATLFRRIEARLTRWRAT